MANLFLFGCHVIDRAYVRTHSSTDCTGRVGQTIKRKGGVSQACLGKSTSFTLDIHNIIIWSIDSCQNRISTDQYHMTISRAHVSIHRGDVIYSEVVRWPVNCLTRSRSMFNLILSGLFRSAGKLIMHTYWTSILWSIDSCQNKVSADQYHLTYRGLRCQPVEVKYFLKLSADKLLVFKYGLKIINRLMLSFF